jgi:hypothetical protein
MRENSSCTCDYSTYCNFCSLADEHNRLKSRFALAKGVVEVAKELEQWQYSLCEGEDLHGYGEGQGCGWCRCLKSIYDALTVYENGEKGRKDE